MSVQEPLIPKHGGYRNLKSFQVAQVVYDVTVRFCDRYINRRSRTHDQMVQAAGDAMRKPPQADRIVSPCRQNTVEGSMASGTSKKMEMKLTNVARASLEELKLDYEDFLRHRRLPLWDRKDPRRAELIARRPGTADDVVRWAMDVHRAARSGRSRLSGQDGQRTRSTPSTKSTPCTPPDYPEIAANGAHALIAVAVALLDRQLAAQAEAFENEGGFTERLYNHRKRRRGY